jgi:2-keto-4-pentenoate hydratase/2-oxohepta-3-ene-1,7-dioic acid hydratase in catechol pathway
MKYARFVHKGKVHYGIVEGDMIRGLFGSILEGTEESGVQYPAGDVKLLPPISPTKIVCIGQNYIGHIKEIGATPPAEPLFFLKPPSSVVGPNEEIVYPRNATRVDYEGELGIVIKRKMKDVPESEAKKYVLGYSCFNDVTERNLVTANPFNLTIAKSFDTFSAFGPYIVTDIDPDNVRVRTYLNNVVKQDDNTRNCIFKVAKVLHYLSQCMTLCPGDVVTTGTPKGVAPMHPGDLVEVELEGIGKLSNRIRAEGSQQRNGRVL